MISIYGRSSAPATPRKHNHFVPDGYIPPKSRQKIVSPPQRTTPRPILKTAASSRGTTPTRSKQNAFNPNSPNAQAPTTPTRRHFNPTSPNYAQAPRTPSRSRQNSPHRRANFTKPTSPHANDHNVVFPNAPDMMPRSILKSSNMNSTSRNKMASNCPVGITPRTASLKSASASPHSQSPAGSSQHGCYVGGDFFEDDYTPSSRQNKQAPGMHKKVLESVRREPNPNSYDSHIGSSPISVVDKYDERDNPIWWKPTISRRGPPAKSSLRPHARHPNILFNRVVNSCQGDEDDGRTSCRASCSNFEGDDSEDEDHPQSSWQSPRLCEPCCETLNWENDELLKSVGYEDRQAFRQCKLEEFLCEVCVRDSLEGFGSFLIRCYAYANEELNSQSRAKHLLGYVDERNLSSLDVWVLRLHRGTVSRLLRSGTVYSGRDSELFLRMLREECVAQGSVLRRHLNATERRVEACNAQERNYKKILLLSQRSPLGVMHNLKRRDWR